MDAIGAAGVPRPPGHSVPQGIDPTSPGAIQAWVESFGTAFSAVLAQKRVAARLVAAGYVDLYSLSLGVDDFLDLDEGQEDELEAEQLLPSEALSSLPPRLCPVL